MIQSPNGLTSGALQLYVDGDKLTNFAEGTAPTYPFEWEIAGASGGYQLPVMDVSEAQTFRLYKRLPTDGEIAIDYQNSCMSPATSLLGDPMLVWGLFNSPSFCNNNFANTTALPVSDRGVLTVSSNPDPGGTQSNNVLTGIQNTFTVEFWVNPNLGVSDNVPDPSNKYAGVDDEPPYAIFPTYGGTVDHANMGVAVGVDGITVFEHTTDYLPGVLDWRGTVNGWTHVAIVYNNLVPSLYVNGEFKATGVASQKSSISPSYNFGGGSYGYMPGGIDEVRIWSVARTQAQIAAAYQHSLLPTDQLGLAGYWPMDNSNGSTIYDFACGNHPAALLSPALTYTDGGPVAETKYVLFAGRFIAPNHGLPTNYAYNSLNQPVQQTTPDAGTSTFVYDRLGRLSISQNAEQLQPAVVDANNPAGRFSYTRYDALGRIAEVGEKLGASPLSDDDARDDTKLTAWLSSGNNRQATVTIYDAKPETWWPSGLDEGFPRKRVAATALLATGSDPSDATSRLAATYYRYDVDGNVAEVMQENKQLVANEKQFVTGSSGLKDIKYDYDLISGKVNKVYYQDGKWDQFYYQYRYDADNRLIGAYTSRYKDLTLDNWNQEALYRYYLHGPLARMELAPKGQTFASAVQGVDYAYTLQGWLKGVNGMALPGPTTGQTDMGGDGTGDLNGQVGTDVIAFTLGYYAGDYISIGGWNEPGWLLFEENYTGAGDLYNGNIEHATYSISQLEGGKGVDYDYHYDQLNRLVAVDRHEMNSSSGAGFTTLRVGDASNNYQERVSYDGNGNILTYLRNGTTAGARPLAMDNLTYNYNRDGNGYLVNNRLRHINDAVPAGNYPAVAGDPVDLHDQAADNYNYDKIGNLIGNAAENISRINWTVYGKMASIAKSGSQGLTFGYDASGNRITKTATAADGTGVTTHYVRDAQGSVLAVYQYKSNASGALTEADWTEQHLYGSSRLGMLLPGVTIPAGQPYGNDAYPYVVTTDPTTGAITSTTDPVGATGSRHYELTNHLGNVLATISDKPATLNASNILAPELLSAQDYYPFGMQMPGRSYLANSSLSYRYGFNGKEKDDEVMGAGNEIDYGMRVYDPRAGRFLSVDALTKTFPALTPYQYAGNSPIKFIDLDGAERYDPNVKPKGISLLEKATVPGGQYAPRTLSAGNYRLVGMVNEKGNDYWIARLWFRSGDRKGMYRDDYIIGVDGVFDFIKNAREYERRANQLEFVRSYWPEAGTDISIPEQYWHMWKQQASNPMTWLNIGMATVASLPGSTQSNSLAAKMGFEEDVSVMPSLSSRDIEGIASEAASRHAVNFECMQCSADIVNALKDEGVSGSILDLEVKNGGKWTNIYSDKAGEVISTNGHHRGVLVGGKVYDNIHTKGISFEEWQKDFHTPSGQFKIDKTDF
jgi:RHS repeat-associated protein